MTIQQLKDFIDTVDPDELGEPILLKFIYDTKTAKAVKLGKITGITFGESTLSLIGEEDVDNRW